MSLEDVREDVYLCARDGYCRDMVRSRDDTEVVCPLRGNVRGFESYTPRGRNWIARQILEGNLDPEEISGEFLDALFSCTLCGNCRTHCLVLDPDSWDRFPDDINFEDHEIRHNKVTRELRSVVIEQGNPPTEVRDVLGGIYRVSNPYGSPRTKRSAWKEDLDFDIDHISDVDSGTLLYIGSVAPYDDRNQRTLKALCRVLNESDLEFGILGNEEEDSGEIPKNFGEEGLFEEMASRNIDIFRKYGVERVICVSPHDYDTFVDDYPELFGDEWEDLDIEVQHYTEVLRDLIEEEKIEIGSFDKTVTFHDPCYLGRIHGIFDEPREIIESTGTDIEEMKLNKKNSFCCGGGGGALWYEAADRPRIESERVKQANETGADVVAVACPNCAQMLEAGVDVVEGCDLEIMDVAEILAESLESS